MKIRPWVFTLALCSTMLLSATWYRKSIASDHDDGESDVKSRSLNLTDHYVWKDTSDASLMNFVQTSNPRSLPGFQYYFSTQARYDIHVTRVAAKTAVPTGADNLIFRFQFQAPDSNNVQQVTMTAIKDGATVGTGTGSTTPIRGTPTINTVTVGGATFKFFAGLREDTFTFDVGRFFEVRDFLATAFFGGATATSVLGTFQSKHKTCNGHPLFEGFAAPWGDASGAAAHSSASNGDVVHLFNPPECAEDFTKNYNRNEIELQTSLASLQASGETVFDTWSTISIPQ